MNWRRAWYLADLAHVHERRAPRRFDECSDRGFARPISKRYTLSDGDARDTNMVRGFVGQCHRSSDNERLSGEKSRYRGAI
jgi:hypothetical protein